MIYPQYSSWRAGSYPQTLRAQTHGFLQIAKMTPSPLASTHALVIQAKAKHSLVIVSGQALQASSSCKSTPLKIESFSSCEKHVTTNSGWWIHFEQCCKTWAGKIWRWSGPWQTAQRNVCNAQFQTCHGTFFLTNKVRNRRQANTRCFFNILSSFITSTPTFNWMYRYCIWSCMGRTSQNLTGDSKEGTKGRTTPQLQPWHCKKVHIPTAKDWRVWDACKVPSTPLHCHVTLKLHSWSHITALVVEKTQSEEWPGVVSLDSSDFLSSIRDVGK